MESRLSLTLVALSVAAIAAVSLGAKLGSDGEIVTKLPDRGCSPHLRNCTCYEDPEGEDDCDFPYKHEPW